MTRRIIAIPDKTEWAGGCSACHERPEKIIVVNINNNTFQLCDKCKILLIEELDHAERWMGKVK